MSRRAVLLTRPRQAAQEPNLGDVQAIDVSNYQDSIAPYLEQWTAWGVEHVCVRLSTESAAHREIAVRQLQTAYAVGLSCSGYVWCYFGLDPAACIGESLDVARQSGVPLSFVWLDAEDEPGPVDPVAWLRAAADEVTQLGYRAGVYSAKWWFTSRVGENSGLSDLPLWVAQYDNDPRLDNVALFGGWASAQGKQFTDNPVDRDVFVRWVTEPV